MTSTPAAAGYPRNWASVMAGVPFAGDRGRDNRPGVSPGNGGLVCDAGKEPNPGPGNAIPTNMYSAQYPAATLAKGQNVRWRWPAKNHANTPAAGTVEVFISTTPNAGDDFSGQGDASYIGQMSYSSDGGDCLGLGTSTDTADCQGTWTVPANIAVGRHTLMWWWEFNTGEFYNTCADVMITAAADGGGGGDPGGGGGGVIAGAPPPPRVLTTTRVSFSVSGGAADITEADKDAMASLFAETAGVVPTEASVSISSVLP